MTIQRNHPRLLRVASASENDGLYETADETSLLWDFDAGRLGPAEEHHSTTSFNTWSDGSSLEASSGITGGAGGYDEITSMADLQRRLLEIYVTGHAVSADLHHRRPRRSSRILDDDELLPQDSLLLHRQALTQHTSTHRWFANETGLPEANHVMLRNGGRDPHAIVDPFLQDSVKLTRARMRDREHHHPSDQLPTISNHESQHHPAALSSSK